MSNADQRRTLNLDWKRRGPLPLTAIMAWIVYAFLLLPSFIIFPISFGNQHEIVFPPPGFHLDLYYLFLAGAMATGLISSAAYAAPALGTQGPQVDNGVDKVAYRCWWAYGERHCAYFYDGDRRIYRRGSPDDYPVGSRGWWREMNRDGRGGQGN